MLSPVRANERGPFVEFFYRTTGRNQHLGEPRSFVSMMRANERGAFFQFRMFFFGEGCSFASMVPRRVRLFVFTGEGK